MNGSPGAGRERSRSPPVSSARSATLAGQRTSSTRSASGVGRNERVIPRPASHPASGSGSVRTASGTTWSEAPDARYGQISQVEASKPTPATSVARSAGATPKVARCQPARFARAACSTITPLGVPVEPEV